MTMFLQVQKDVVYILLSSRNSRIASDFFVRLCRPESSRELYNLKTLDVDKGSRAIWRSSYQFINCMMCVLTSTEQCVGLWCFGLLCNVFIFSCSLFDGAMLVPDDCRFVATYLLARNLSMQLLVLVAPSTV